MGFIGVTLKEDDSKMIINVNIIDMIRYEDDVTKIYSNVLEDSYIEIKETYEEIRDMLYTPLPQE